MQSVDSILPPDVIHPKLERKVEDDISTNDKIPQPNGYVLLTFLSFFLACIACWFATSRVYRADLPSLLPLEHHAAALLTRTQPVHLIVLSFSSTQSDIPPSLQAYANALPSDLSSHLPSFYSLDVSIQTLHASPSLLSSSSTPEDIDGALLSYTQSVSHANSSGVVLPPLRFFFLSFQSPPPSLAGRWWMGSSHHGYYLLPSLDSSAFSSSLPRLTALLTLCLSLHSPSSSPLALPYSPSYHFSFSLLTSSPSPSTFTWNFSSISSDFLNPFFASTSLALSLTSDSQSLCCFLLSSSSSSPSLQSLKALVGSMGWMIGSPLMHHTVELVAYIPEVERRPLKVKEEDGGGEVEAFVVPGWGGMVMANGVEGGGEAEVEELQGEVVEEVMQHFMTMMRVMLGLPEDVWPHSNSSVSSFSLLPSPSGIAGWERTALFARFLSLHLRSAFHDLSGLASLISTTSHMPVDDYIALLIQQSIDEAHLASQHCEREEWEECGKAAQRCSIAAHNAFYNETLLPSLYFPEEHLYAVYAPLFLPISMPVLAAVLARVRQWRKKRKMANKEKKG